MLCCMYYPPGLDSLPKYNTLSIYKRYSLHFKDSVLEIWRVFFLFCSSAARQLVAGGEIENEILLESHQDSHWQEAISQSWVMNWSLGLEAARARGQLPLTADKMSSLSPRGQMWMFLCSNQPSHQSWAGLTLPTAADADRRCRCTAHSKMPPLHLWEGLDTNKAPSVTVAAHQDVGSMLTSTKLITSGLVPVLGMFAWVFKIKIYIWKWDFDREKYSVNNLNFIKNKGPNSSVHHSRITLMIFHGVLSSEKFFSFKPS